MDLLQCPECRKPSFSRLRKLFLGGRSSMRCAKCGAKIGVLRSGAIFVVLAVCVLSPFGFAGGFFFGLIQLNSMTLGFIFSLIGGVLICSPVFWFYVSCVPLVKKAA